MSQNQAENLYQTDFHRWAIEQARKIRAGEPIDVEHVAEELEDLGRRERRELRNHLAVLLSHMLKWDYQPEKRSPSWEGSIKIQRHQANQELTGNPSLKPYLPEAITDAYAIAVLQASIETGKLEADFPSECPYTVEEILSASEQRSASARKAGLAGGRGRKKK